MLFLSPELFMKGDTTGLLVFYRKGLGFISTSLLKNGLELIGYCLAFDKKLGLLLGTVSIFFLD